MPHRIFAGLALALIAMGTAEASEVCRASWYGAKSGNRTASGERFDPNGMTCARPSFRAGHRPYLIRVVNLGNGRSAVCRVNDRGPHASTGKCLDVSKGVAARLGMVRAGTAKVLIVPLK